MRVPGSRILLTGSEEGWQAILAPTPVPKEMARKAEIEMEAETIMTLEILTGAMIGIIQSEGDSLGRGHYNASPTMFSLSLRKSLRLIS
jgi:hypothetical protein